MSKRVEEDLKGHLVGIGVIRQPHIMTMLARIGIVAFSPDSLNPSVICGEKSVTANPGISKMIPSPDRLSSLAEGVHLPSVERSR